MPLPSRMPSKKALNKMGSYDLISKFPGYRAREDVTTLPQGTLISPSQNVVIKTSGRVSLVKGYKLDGTGSTVIDSGILSHYDFINFTGATRNMRAGFMTSALNDGKLQYRYLVGSTVNWVDLVTGMTNVRLSYTPFYDSTNLVPTVKWVDGTNNIFSWNGAVTTLASATATTVTKQGTNTWTQEGFSATGSIVIGGVTATYSGGAGTTTLTGVSVDFSVSVVASIVHQAVVTTALSGMNENGSNLATFGPTVIATGRRNQIYLGSSKYNSLYISKVNSFTDYRFSSPALDGEGGFWTLTSPPVAMIPQEYKPDANQHDIFVAHGNNTWSEVYYSTFTTADSTGLRTLTQVLNVNVLKSSFQQAPISERLTCKMKNSIAFVGKDKVSCLFGMFSFNYVPSMVDFSFPVVDDMNSYDFTDGSIFYYQNYIYEAIPKAGVVRIYNMTDQTKQYTSFTRDLEDVTQQPWFWEAPITYPVSGFYVTPDKGLCAHSYTTSESYQVFTGGSFNTQQIEANATFSYDDKGDRTQSKGSDELWIEGYIKQNTKLNATVSGDLDTFATQQTVVIDGSDNTIVAYGGGGHSLGKDKLGSKPLGGSDLSTATRSAWFHVAKTYTQVPFYLESVSFGTKGVDLDWELITFGSNATETVEGNNSISQ